MAVVSDEQVIGQLASRNRAEADAAVGEIMHRGPQMIPLLLKQRGNRDFFPGTSLLNPRASILLPVPSEGMPLPESEKDRVITVEAAALYLISAILAGELNFSRAPLLLDLDEPQGKRTIANTPERLKRAFDAAEQWHRSGRAASTQKGRAAANDPLAASNLRWY